MRNIIILILILATLLCGSVSYTLNRDAYNSVYRIFTTIDSSGTRSEVMTSKPFELAITMGQVSGYSSLYTFGENNSVAIGNEDIWDGSSLYIYDTNGTAPIKYLISDSTADTVNIRVTGLDSAGNEVIQSAVLNGDTTVVLSTPLWRVYRMENIDSTDLIGNVYCSIDSAGVPVIGDTRAMIVNGNNRTLMALYTIPKGKVGFLYRGEAGIQLHGTGASSTTQFAKVLYKSRRYGGVFNIRRVGSLMVGGTSIFQDNRSFPDVIPALTDIKMHVESVTEEMGAWATFDILLIDESYFPVSYLQAIGQPGY